MKTPLPKYGTYNLSYTGIVDPPRVFSSFRYPWIPNFFAADSKGSQSFSTIPQRETQPTTEGHPKSTHVLLWSAKGDTKFTRSVVDVTLRVLSVLQRCLSQPTETKTTASTVGMSGSPEERLGHSSVPPAAGGM